MTENSSGRPERISEGTSSEFSRTRFRRHRCCEQALHDYLARQDPLTVTGEAARELFMSMFEGLGTSLAGFGVQRLAGTHRSSGRIRATVFTAGPDPHMAGFYDYLGAKIKAARHCVYLTGKGFDPSLDCEQVASRLVAAISQALRRGVPVIRLQTHPVISDFWHEQLRALKAEFPQFEVHALVNAADLQPPSMCAIDIDDPARNVTEMMLERRGYLGTQHHDAAAYAVFHKGCQRLARDVGDQVIELTGNPDISRRLETAEAVTGFFRGEYYFAYGSNMEPSQMRARCPSAIQVCTAVLPDHKLIFNRSGTYRPGGVANVQPAAGDRVYGILWKLAASDFRALDDTEDPRAYCRQAQRIYSMSGQPYDCHIYLAVADRSDIPDQHYLGTLIRAAHRADLPPEYIARLQNRRY